MSAHADACGEADLLRRGDVPGLTAPGEADSREGVAGVRVVSLRRVVDGGAGDGSVEGLDGGGRAVHDGGAGVDDGLEVGVRVLGADDRLGACGLPETGRGVDAVVLDRASVLGGVGAAEEERRAGGGELEAEDAGADLAAAD